VSFGARYERFGWRSKNTGQLKMKNNDAKLAKCFLGGVQDLVFWTFRYFLGRKTIATCCFADELSKAWPLLNDKNKVMIRRELLREFDIDNKARKDWKSGMKWFPLGDDCDRAAWLKVLDAAEKKR
jgi:hypothetical protein